jgi:hypothetical protein
VLVLLLVTARKQARTNKNKEFWEIPRSLKMVRARV